MTKLTKKDYELLPEDLIIDIAVCLPAKSIGQFRCVSKEWNTFLSSPEFVKSHLNRATDHKDVRFIFQGWRNHTPHVITPRKCRTLGKEYENFIVQGSSCNGLVLLKDAGSSNLVVMNPITLRATKIPAIKPAAGCFEIILPGILGYNPVDDDYKIVTILRNENLQETRVSILSLKTRTCKKPVDCPFLDALHEGVYVGGCLHWLVRERERYAIFAFDLSTENFEEVASPVELDPMRYPIFAFDLYGLREIGGCLALIHRRYKPDRFDRDVMTAVDVWIMEKPGHWRKFIIANDPQNLKYGDDRFDVVCRLGEFEFIVVPKYYRRHFIAYNCNTGIWRDMDIDGLPKYFKELLSFRESLVCPDDPA